jgi:hypothetical protein
MLWWMVDVDGHPPLVSHRVHDRTAGTPSHSRFTKLVLLVFFGRPRSSFIPQDMKGKIVHLVHNPLIFYLSLPWHRGDRRLPPELLVKVHHCAEDYENTALVPAAT